MPDSRQRRDRPPEAESSMEYKVQCCDPRAGNLLDNLPRINQRSEVEANDIHL